MGWLKDDDAGRQFEAFVGGATDTLYRTGYFMTWDATESEDLVQDALVRVASHWDRVRTAEHPVAYARRVLVNLALDQAEHRSRRRCELGLSSDGLVERSDEPAARSLGAIDNEAELRWALAALSRRERAVLFLRYWEDLSEAETAQALGCSVGTVKKTTWRAVGHLRQQLVRAASTWPQVPRVKSQEGRPS